MSANNGGPAFPAPYPCGPSGMTLRDYFAAKALDGMLSSPRTPGQISWVELAAHSYAAADAMLSEREAK